MQVQALKMKLVLKMDFNTTEMKRNKYNMLNYKARNCTSS